MPIYKNVAGQSIGVFAYDGITNAAKTGDAANITAYISKDFGTGAAITDTNPTEMDATNMPGWYEFELTQAETNANVLVIAPKSTTSNIILEQVQVVTDAPDDVLSVVYESTETIQDFLQFARSVLYGIASGGGTSTIVFKAADGTTTRISATVDSSGNRSAVSLNP